MTELYCPSCEALSDGDADRSRDEAAHLPGERSGSPAWRHDRAELPGLTIPFVERDRICTGCGHRWTMVEIERAKLEHLKIVYEHVAEVVPLMVEDD